MKCIPQCEGNGGGPVVMAWLLSIRFGIIRNDDKRIMIISAAAFADET
jgi:hypothetical protein